LQTLGFGFEESAGILVIFVIGGTLTVSSALPRIVALLADTGSFALLGQDSAAIGHAIDEGLRFVTPLAGTVRIVRRDTSLGSYRLTAGCRLVILTCNMARDAKLFPEPNRFNVSRTQGARAERLWYGTGPHQCAGFHLAQAQLSAALGALSGNGANLRIVKRRAAFDSLLPAYRQLLVRAEERHRQ
jgi:cytochrome P450